MIITYHGGQSFKVTLGDTTLALNPGSKQSKLSKPIKYGADVVFVSLWQPDFNGVEEVKHGSKQPFIVDTPGEYEIGQVTARGFGVKTTYANQETFNTIHQHRLEEMNLVFLGALTEPDIDPKILSELGDIDVLFLPIGGGDVLEVPPASKLAVKLEAKLIIPMHFDSASLKAFLQEESKEGLKPVDKLTLKRKDVHTMQGEVVVLAVK